MVYQTEGEPEAQEKLSFKEKFHLYSNQIYMAWWCWHNNELHMLQDTLA